MSTKISIEEQVYCQSKHIAGEVSLLIEGLARVNRLISELKEIPLTEINKNMENEVKTIHDISELLPTIGTLLLYVKIENLRLVRNTEKTCNLKKYKMNGGK